MALLIAGGVSTMMQSFGYLPQFGMSRLSCEHYRAALSQGRFVTSLCHTLCLSLASAALSVLFGLAIAFLIRRTGSERSFLYTLYKVPIILPHLVVVILMLGLFSQTGVFSRLAFALGLISGPNDFPLMVFDRGGIGIMLVYLYKQIPFVTLTVFAVLLKLDLKYGEIAGNLGAGAGLILTRVVLPQLAPVILSAFLICFAFAFGAFEVPFLMGSPARATLPVLAYHDYTSVVLAQRPRAMAMNIIVSVFSLGLIWLYMRLFRFFSRRGLEGGLL